MGNLTKTIINGDIKLFYLINEKIKCNSLDKIMPLITHLGGTLFTINFTLFLYFFGDDKLKKVGLEAFLALITSGMIVQIVKRIFNRARPYTSLEEVNLIKPPFCMRSFPSGHTTAAFSLAVILAGNFPAMAWIIKSIAGLVGISRAYVGVHYPSDILTGAAIGFYFSNWIQMIV